MQKRRHPVYSPTWNDPGPNPSGGHESSFPLYRRAPTGCSTAAVPVPNISSIRPSSKAATISLQGIRFSTTSHSPHSFANSITDSRVIPAKFMVDQHPPKCANYKTPKRKCGVDGKSETSVLISNQKIVSQFGITRSSFATEDILPIENRDKQGSLTQFGTAYRKKQKGGVKHRAI